ncbi:MAG: hypothetical protein J6U54_21060 [Clostridiales bacterium]|nr:hypothetical protein [Clostridiales bacterium]
MNTTKETNTKKTSSKEVLVMIAVVLLFGIGSVAFGTFMIGTPAPFIGVLVFEIFLVVMMIKRYIAIKAEEEIAE